MKKLLLLAIGLFSFSPIFAQHWLPEMGVGYVYSSPTRGMKQTISRANGLNIFMGATNPSARLTYGLDLNYGVYGHEKSKQEYDMGDGTFAPMNVVVNNSFTNLMAVARLNLITKGSVRPFVLVKSGYSWYRTNLNIYDEDDADSCEPVESKLLQKDGNFVYSVGGGVQINLSSIFRRAPKNFLYLDLQSSMTSGGRVKYMNTDAPSTANQQNYSTRSSDVTAPFLNTLTQIKHPHHVGYLYSSYINMMDFRLGFTIKPAF